MEADIAILDSHNPAKEVVEHMPEIHEQDAHNAGYPPNHHHILVRFKNTSDVLSTGLLVGEGEPHELLIPHITRVQNQDPNYSRRLVALTQVLHTESLGLFFISDRENISQTPEGRAFLDTEGGLYNGTKPPLVEPHSS